MSNRSLFLLNFLKIFVFSIFLAELVMMLFMRISQVSLEIIVGSINNSAIFELFRSILVPDKTIKSILSTVSLLNTFICLFGFSLFLSLNSDALLDTSLEGCHLLGGSSLNLIFVIILSVRLRFMLMVSVW